MDRCSLNNDRLSLLHLGVKAEHSYSVMVMEVAAAVEDMSISTEYSLAVNDYVELVVYQSSGGALDVNAAANYSPEFGMTFQGKAST